MYILAVKLAILDQNIYFFQELSYMLNWNEPLHEKITNLQELETEAQADLEDLNKYINQLNPGYSREVLEQKRELKKEILKSIGAELNYMKK